MVLTTTCVVVKEIVEIIVLVLEPAITPPGEVTIVC